MNRWERYQEVQSESDKGCDGLGVRDKCVLTGANFAIQPRAIVYKQAYCICLGKLYNQFMTQSRIQVY